ncbi:nucleotidyltransferase family protein [Nonomuraea sp. SYSU D8015]|uniref:nucleotidyltransferase family protein n=1 Tax=Nonomuraea sp. SYSU D8015 TaxID=2593644 RepID=UPI001CB7464F|nr:nucleotidyltransferase family protein [Nonomuraea sp. SYSU D8015]
MLRRARTLDLPGWWVAAGAVVQTIWNHVTGRDPGHGIKDYDLIYHDPSDLSWEAEDVAIRAGREVFGEVPVEIRNDPSGEWKLYAPYGVTDAFGLVLRPDPRQAPRHVYEAKVARWTAAWPELTALPWPDGPSRGRRSPRPGRRPTGPGGRRPPRRRPRDRP